MDLNLPFYPAYRDPSRMFTQYATKRDKRVFYHDDFFGDALATHWAVVDVGGGTETVGTDAANGTAQIALDATSEAQDAVLYHGDNRNFHVGRNMLVEILAAVTVLPTAGTTLVFGVGGDHNLDKDTMAESAWFRLDGDGALDVETDDTTNNNDDISTGLTIVAGEFNLFQIDFANLRDVRFYVNGARYAGGTTFDMQNLAGAELILQPYFSLDKASGTSIGTLAVDYIKIWTDRD